MKSIKLTIGELAVRIKSADLAAQVIDTAIASDFDVEVSYEHRAEDGEESVEIKAVRACANVHFSGDVTDTIVRRGSDILPLFSGYQATALADLVLKAIREAGDE